MLSELCLMSGGRMKTVRSLSETSSSRKTRRSAEGSGLAAALSARSTHSSKKAW